MTGLPTGAEADRDRTIREAEIVKRPFAFLWQVPRAGIQWRTDPLLPSPHRRREDDQGPGPWLVAAPAAAWPVEWRQYAPLDRANLHRQFARLGTDDAIERFASRYGLLGHSETVANPIRRGESHGRWTREIAAMNTLIQRWELVKQRRWDRKPALKEAYLGHLRFGDGGQGVIDEERLEVYTAVNDRLRGHIDSIAHPRRGGEILHWPDCLLSALYLLLQFEFEFRPARVVRCQLETCGRPIDDPGNSRQRFCCKNHGNLYRYHRKKHPDQAEP